MKKVFAPILVGLLLVSGVFAQEPESKPRTDEAAVKTPAEKKITVSKADIQRVTATHRERLENLQNQIRLAQVAHDAAVFNYIEEATGLSRLTIEKGYEFDDQSDEKLVIIKPRAPRTASAAKPSTPAKK